MLAGYEWTWTTDVGHSIDMDPGVERELKTILLTAVDADPERRFPSIVDVRVALTAYLERIWPGRTW